MMKGKIILKGTVELLSPALIGSGKDEKSDMDVLKDSQGRVYIPSTSFTGMLRHYIKINDKNNLELFWGSSNEETDPQKIRQSSIRIDDLLPLNEISTVIRDGVKINNTKGIAEEGAKFDYEVIEPGAKFALNIEVTLYDSDNDFKRRMVATIIDVLKNEKITIGAKTNSGLGRIKLTDYKIYEFDFSKKEDVLRWLKQDFSVPSNSEVKPFEPHLKTFTISADFVIKNSLIVRSYNYDPDMPDVEHIKSNNKPVLPGTSLKGTIRARSERIMVLQTFLWIHI